jgi:hypothetical protein
MTTQDLTLSIIMPARDEQESIVRVLGELRSELDREGIPYEIVIVDDHSASGASRTRTRPGSASPSVPGSRRIAATPWRS